MPTAVGMVILAAMEVCVPSVGQCNPNILASHIAKTGQEVVQSLNVG
jgi:hypothetical protein